MGDRKRGRFTNSVPDASDVDTVELVPELQDLLSEHLSLAPAGPERSCRALRTLRGIRADVCTVEAVLEALGIEGEVLA